MRRRGQCGSPCCVAATSSRFPEGTELVEFYWAIIWSGSSISSSFRNSKCQSAKQYRRRWKWHDRGHSSALVSLSGEAHSRSLNPLLFRTRFAYLVTSFTVLVLKITNNSTVGHTEHFGNKFYSAGSEGFEGFNFDNNKLQRIFSPLLWYTAFDSSMSTSH